MVGWRRLIRKRDRRINREYNGVLRLRIMRIVRAVGMIRARVRGRRKYRMYGGVRVRLVRISYEVVLLLVLLRLGRRWRGEGGKERMISRKRWQGIKEIGEEEVWNRAE